MGGASAGTGAEPRISSAATVSPISSTSDHFTALFTIQRSGSPESLT